MMKRFCKNIAPNNPPTPHPVMSGGYSIFCRALVALVIVFAFVSPAWGAPAIVQQNTGSQTNYNSLTVTLTNPTTVGNLLIMVGANDSGPLASVSGGGAATWSQATGSYINANCEIWYGVVTTSSSTGVTISLGTTGNTWMNLTEWSGLVGTQSQVLDTAASTSGGSGTSPASAGNITTTNANDLLIFGVAAGTTVTFGTPTVGGTPGPWSAMTSVATGSDEVQSSWYQNLSATGTFNPSVSVGTQSWGWDAAIAAFKASAAPANLNQAHVRWRNDDGGETGSGGTVSLLGSWATPEQDASISYTAPAGTDRVNVLVVSNESGGAYFTTASGCTGNMVRAAYGVGGASAITVFYEAIGSSASSTTCTLTATGATESYAIITAATFENVVQTEGSDDQTGSSLALYNAVSGGANSATPGSIELPGSPATPEGGLVVYGINVNGGIPIATPSGFTEEVDVVGGSNVTSGGERTSTTESDSVTLNVATESSTANRWSAVEIALNPTSGGSGATFDIDEDTELTGLAKNTNTRLRFLVSNSGGISSGVNYQLEFAETGTCGSGSYSVVPASAGGGDKWHIVDSTYITDGEATSDIDDGVDDALPNPGGMTFVPGELRDDNSNSTSGITLDQNEFTEIEFTIQATDDALDGTHYCFKLTDSGTDLDSYSHYAEATLSGMPPDSALNQAHYRWRNDDGGESGGTGWWDDLWSRRKTITIDNTGNSNTLTNYQVQVTATYDSDMQTDFDDIRFTNSSGTELDYWMESKTDSVSATFWVEVDSIAASSNTTIYMYYGNASVTTTSNAKNTMFIYENMDSAPTTGTLKNNAYYDAANKYVVLTTTALGPGQFEYSSSPTPGFVAEWRFWTGGGTGADAVWLYNQTSITPAFEDGPTNGYSFPADEYDNQLQVYYNNNTNKLSYSTETTIDNSTWHNVEIVFYQSGGTYYYQFWYDGTQRITSSSTNTPSGSLFGWGARIGGSTDEHRIDDLVVRKYTSPEPGVSLAGEEVLSTGATWAADQDTKLTGIPKGDIYRVRFEISNEGTGDSGDVTYKLQVAQTADCGSGIYSDVTTGTGGHWQIADSTHFTDGDGTTDVASGLQNEGTTFVPGELKDTSNTTGIISLDTDAFTEIEFAIKATGDATDGGSYCFRLYDASGGGAPLDSYPVYAEVGLAIPTPFSYRKAITIDHTRIGATCGADPTNFPVLIKIAGDNDIRTTANGGHVTSPYGYDIIFRALDDTTCGADGPAPCTLDHEIEYYNGSGGGGISETGSYTAVGGSGNASITHGLTINTNDVIIAMVHVDTAGNTISDANGSYPFQQAIQEDGAASDRYAIYYRVAGGSEPTSYSWSHTSDDWTVQIRVFSGVDTSSVWDVAPSTSTRTIQTSSTNPATAPSMETQTDGALGIIAFFTDRSSYTFSSPTNGYGSEVEPTSGTGRMQASYIRTWATAGATGPSSATQSTAYSWVAHQFALKPAGGGNLVAWVRIPTLTRTADQVIYMYYGNSSITNSTERANGEAVWDSNYVGVWHLKESGNGTAGEFKDSTSHANNAQGGGGDSNNTPAQATGKFNFGQDFDGTSDFIQVPHNASLNLTSQLTLEAWVNLDACTNSKIVGKTDADHTRGYLLGISGTCYVYPEIWDSAGGHFQLDGAGTQVTPFQWEHVAVTWTTNGNMLAYLNGNQVNQTSAGGNPIGTSTLAGAIGMAPWTPSWWTNGRIDEVRISNAARSACWIQTEHNNQNWPNKAQDPANGFVTVDAEEGTPPTAVDLLSFKATGSGDNVVVSWETAQEVNHLGFELYRAGSRSGPFVKLTDKVIPGLGSSVQGQAYRFEDTGVSRGELYYYRLEAIDVSGKKTPYGPICVDWDGDGMPDDWERAHGLNPDFDDCLYDYDGDGLSNCREYELGTDPFNPDTDGDGILDGQEIWRPDRSEPALHTLSPGVTVISRDERGITLELRTDGFEATPMEAQGEHFERLRIWQYIHGLTNEVGKPELPVKGVLLDLPEGKSASLEVLETEDETLGGYRVYPVPEKVADDGGGTSRVQEVFRIDEAAYSEEGFYPGEVALLGETYTVRDQSKVQVLFHPLSFNPALGELLHHKRIRVRVDYEDNRQGMLVGQGVLVARGVVGSRALAWTPPTDGSTYKIGVEQEGIYRLTTTWLQAQGVEVSTIDLSQVRIYNLGQEIAISVYDENEDNQFDPEDYIDFYGRPPDAAYAKYARDNVYWFILSGGTGEPERMAEITASPASAPLATTHSSTVVNEQNGRYGIRAPGGDAIERWFYSTRVLGSGYGSGGGPQTYSFTLSGVSGSGQGSLTVSMAAYADLDHQVEISVNGIPKGTYSWSGIAWYEATINGVNLSEGTNTVTIDCGDGLDTLYIDRLTVTYPRSFASSGDLLKFSHTSGYLYEVTGFADNHIVVYDITSPGEVQVMGNVQISEAGPPPYTAAFEPPSAAEGIYLVLSEDGTKSPVAISKDRRSTLSASQNGADYIVITHRDLGWDGEGEARSWLTELLQLREDQGLRVMAVDIENIYDEFSYGLSTPQAVKDFLTHAYQNWAPPAPRYVLLVGDGSFDPKDHYGTGATSFIPPYLTVTENLGETVSEDWLVRVSGDDAMADLFIGRLPADSPEEADLMVNKIHDYETSPNTKTWEKTVLLISDNQTQDYESAFEEMNETVASLLPSGYSSLRGYLGDYCPVVDTCSAAPLTEDLTGWITTGALVAHYSGHGSTQIWANEHIFDTGDVSALANGNRLPFFVSMSCLTGYFANPEAEFLKLPTSLAEVLLLASGNGAVAAFMPSGMTGTDGQEILDRALFEAIFTQDIRTLGEAIAHAKETLLAQGSQYEDVSQTFLLFGDPAMALKVPLPRRPQGVSAQGKTTSVTLSWNGATDCNGGTVSGYNLYRSTTPDGPYTQVNTTLITGTQYDDTSVASGTSYYYVVTSVDDDDYESVRSQEASGSRQSAESEGSGGGGGGGCFIDTVAGK